MAQAAWYQYAYDTNFGQPDPVGPYPKPDANFYGIPDGTAITALASGTVTGVRKQPWDPLAYSVTIRMDTPYNSVAKYTAYNYVSHPSVAIGQHVNVGDTVAYAGNPYNIGTAFALSDTPVYGTGSANEPFSGNYVSPDLNPVPFLQGTLPNGGGIGIGDGTVSQQSNSNNLLGASGGSTGPNSVAGFDFTRFIDAGLLLIIGVVLLIVGGLLLANKMGIPQDIGRAATLASVA